MSLKSHSLKLGMNERKQTKESRKSRTRITLASSSVLTVDWIEHREEADAGDTWGRRGTSVRNVFPGGTWSEKKQTNKQKTKSLESQELVELTL